MNQVDEFGMMEVEVNGAIERRPAEVRGIDSLLGRPLFRHAVPELRENEILCNVIGRPPVIIKTHT